MLESIGKDCKDCSIELLTKELDEIATIGKARGKHSQSVCSAGVLATNLDGDGRTARARLDAVSSGELDEIGHADSSVSLNRLEVTAETLEAPVLVVGALVGQDQRPIASTVEAVVKR